MGLGMIILRELGQTDIIWYHVYVKSKINELTCKTEIDPQTSKRNLCLPGGKGWEGIK